MDDYRWILLVLESILTYFGSRRGTKNYHAGEDAYVPDSKHDKIPLKLIRKHFNLQPCIMHWSTYCRYIMTYALFLRIFIMFVIGVVLRFNIYYYIIQLASVFLIACLGLPSLYMGITVVRAQKRKAWQRRKASNKTGSLAAELRRDMEVLKILKEANQAAKVLKWEKPMVKQLEKCLCRQKGDLYLPEDSIKYVEAKILSQYHKYVYHEISSGELETVVLSVYHKKDNRLIFQKPIKK